jgi:hypothetical protein
MREGARVKSAMPMTPMTPLPRGKNPTTPPIATKRKPMIRTYVIAITSAGCDETAPMLERRG